MRAPISRIPKDPIRPTTPATRGYRVAGGWPGQSLRAPVGISPRLRSHWSRYASDVDHGISNLPRQQKILRGGGRVALVACTPVSLRPRLKRTGGQATSATLSRRIPLSWKGLSNADGRRHPRGSVGSRPWVIGD